MYRGFCINEDHCCLFDVPGYSAFNEPKPIELGCQGCSTVYRILKDGKDGVAYKVKGTSEVIKAEKYD